MDIWKPTGSSVVSPSQTLAKESETTQQELTIAGPPPTWERMYYFLHCFSAVGFGLCVHKVGEFAGKRGSYLCRLMSNSRAQSAV